MSIYHTSLIRKLLPLLILLPMLSGAALALDIQSVIREVEQQYMGTSSRARTTMQVKTSHWERTLEMETWSLERDYSWSASSSQPRNVALRLSRGTAKFGTTSPRSIALSKCRLR